MTTDKFPTIKLPDELLIYEMSALKVEALHKLDQVCPVDSNTAFGRELIVLAESVAVVDAAGLQFLVSLRQECKKRSVKFVIMKPSDALCRASNSMGIDSYLFDAENIGRATDTASGV